MGGKSSDSSKAVFLRLIAEGNPLSLVMVKEDTKAENSLGRRR